MAKTGGLAGVVAGETAISDEKKANNLRYRGYSIHDLAEYCCFEEVAYLLIYGKLPNRQELNTYRMRLSSMRDLPIRMKKVLEQIPATAHPMDVLRTGASFMGNIEPESEKKDIYYAADRLLATFPAMLVYWWKFSRNGEKITCTSEAEGVAAHFLTLLHAEKPSELLTHAMNVSLILYAEHEFDVSTFTARTISSTAADYYSAVTGAIGALSGPFHGRANEEAMDLIETLNTPQEAEKTIQKMLDGKQIVMGFGHRVHTSFDPRNAAMKKCAEALAKDTNNQEKFAIFEAVEKAMKDGKELFPNLDFYTAAVYHFMRIPTPMFTPLFVMGHVCGWSGHVLEQRQSRTLIRPDAEYIGSEDLDFVTIEERENAVA